jgi:hypothetical protein
VRQEDDLFNNLHIKKGSNIGVKSLTKILLFLDMLKLSKDFFFQRNSFCEEK